MGTEVQAIPQDAPALIATHAAIADAHHAAYSTPNRSFLIFAEYGSGAVLTNWGDLAVWEVNAAGEYIHFSFRVPADFGSLVAAKIIWSNLGSAGNESIDWTVTTDFGAEGEDYDVHSDSDTGNGVNTYPTKDIVALDVSAALTGLAANDYVGMKFLCDAVAGTFPGIYVLGLYFAYSE